ncbi:MAG: nucleotide exchange factor GrpE [Cellulosilyticum sp.]|nr:nucleotide exchange factor GrpE [Cellulosilyticum sp.]
MEENQNVDQVQEEQVEEVVTETTENEVASEAQEEVVEESTEDTRLKESEAKAAEYLDRWQRLMAEFDNFRKRSEKEKADSYDYAVSNTVVEMLPIIDNFERALKVESTDKALFAGVEMIYKQMMGLLEKLHVTPIEALGKEFDPNLHNAIMHIDDETLGENMVAEELQKGYLYKEEKVIRHSLVKVAN